MDRCAGRRLAEWLGDGGHDVLDTRNLGPDPGDTALLERAASENRGLITVDKDFGELIYLRGTPHAGLVRLPDVPDAPADRPSRGGHQPPRPCPRGTSHNNRARRTDPDLVDAGTLNDKRGASDLSGVSVEHL